MPDASDSDHRIRVFLLDDHEVVRRGVQELLENEGDIVVVGEASTAAEALVRVPALRPDVAVLDVRLPDGDGMSLLGPLRERTPHLIDGGRGRAHDVSGARVHDTRREKGQ